MTTLKDIKPSISEMPEPEALELLRKIRKQRGVYTRGDKKFTLASFSKQVEGLSPEKRTELWKQLSGEEKGEEL